VGKTKHTLQFPFWNLTQMMTQAQDRVNILGWLNSYLKWSTMIKFNKGKFKSRRNLPVHLSSANNSWLLPSEKQLQIDMNTTQHTIQDNITLLHGLGNFNIKPFLKWAFSLRWFFIGFLFAFACFAHDMPF